LIEPAAALLKLQLNPVLFVAVLAYVVVVVPLVNWQLGSVPDEIVIAVGLPTVGVTVTVVVAAADGPLHPFAVTPTVAVPEKPGAQLTVPLVPVPEIVFPVPETVQLYVVALVADVV
jgi:hypothetical protein